jgi:putative flippase GtrA
MLFKFLKFGIVGFTGMVIDFSITFLLKEKFKIHRYISSSAGFTIAASSNYLFNRIWTFSSNNPKILIEYGTFIIVSLIGLAINNLFLYIFEMKFKFRFYAAKLFAIAVTLVWNFLANYYLTFIQ